QIGFLASATSTPPGLVEADMERLRAARPQFTMLCAQLADYRIPPTLVHGDLHMGNVALRYGEDGQRTFLFFDWTDACISHPFLDLIALTGSLDSDAREAIAASYLEPWTNFESMPRLRQMLALALPLISLHQAISYRAIDEGSEALFMHGDTPAIAVWLRQAL